MNKPTWTDGNPTNLEAAALDALLWLYFLRDQDAVRLGPKSKERLLRCIEELENKLQEQT
jgi:hypothetical protein